MINRQHSKDYAVGVGSGLRPRFAPIGMHKVIYTVGPNPFEHREHFIKEVPVYRHDYCPLGCKQFMPPLEKIDFNIHEFYEQLMRECRNDS